MGCCSKFLPHLILNQVPQFSVSRKRRYRPANSSMLFGKSRKKKEQEDASANIEEKLQRQWNQLIVFQQEILVFLRFDYKQFLKKVSFKFGVLVENNFANFLQIAPVRDPHEALGKRMVDYANYISSVEPDASRQFQESADEIMALSNRYKVFRFHRDLRQIQPTFFLLYRIFTETSRSKRRTNCAFGAIIGTVAFNNSCARHWHWGRPMINARTRNVVGEGGRSPKASKNWRMSTSKNWSNFNWIWMIATRYVGIWIKKSYVRVIHNHFLISIWILSCI